MDYSIYKDDNVISTVDRIQKILNVLGINMIETCYDVPTAENYMPGYTNYPFNCKYLPYSSRVMPFGINEIGTNGKGTSEANCKASAYSEFMERLQNQAFPNELLTLSSDIFIFAPDEQECNENAKHFISKYKYKELLSACQPKKVLGMPSDNIFIPYFNIKDNQLHYLPPPHYVFTSNGMAAGNTPEEALVQGFSEICERYAHKQIIINKLSMPDIPKKYYKKYERIMGLIDYAEQLGWEVIIKDASLGLGLPVACTIFKNKKNGIISYKFGSQPSLPVAIERTITEFFQGGVLKDSDIENRLFHIEDYSKKGLKSLFPLIDERKRFYKRTDKISHIFLDNKPNYEFSANNWIDENKKYTNKELLKILVDKITKITDNDIYIRDVSFLGFPSFHIFIPEVSVIEYFDSEEINMYRWLHYPDSKEGFSENVDNLISAIFYRQKYAYNQRTIAKYVPDEYLLILCYILKNDSDNIIKYCEILKKQKKPDFVPKFVSKHENLINLIHQYYKLKQQKESKTVINNIIRNIYNKKTVDDFFDLINNSNFEYIKNLIAKSNEETHNNDDCETQEEINMKNKIREIKQRLIQKYIENAPDQMKLAKVFDFSGLNK